MRSASVLIPAYNEAQNIVPLLRRIAGDDGTTDWRLDDIIVIASGCTDETIPRVEQLQGEIAGLRLLRQPEREGKASAINLGLTAARHDTIVLSSSDVLPAPGAIPLLLQALRDPEVGVVGGRPLPANDESSFTGYAAHLLWRLHHRICLSSPEPKCGEIIAFRRRVRGRLIVPGIPVDSAVDEVSVQALIHDAGLRTAYVPGAVIHNWGPETVSDWFAQRRRINAGHIAESRNGYQPTTMRTGNVLRAIVTDRQALHRPHWLLAVVGLEVAARLRGKLDTLQARDHAVWKIAATTKRPIEDEVA